MFRRQHHENIVRRNRIAPRNGRTDRLLSRRRFSVESLEPRYMLSSQPWVAQGPSPTINGGTTIPPDFEVNGAVQAVAANPTNPNIMYVGAVNGGVWKTTNAADLSPTWTPLTDALPSQSITALTADPTDPAFQTVIAGTGLRSSEAFEGDDQVGLYYTTNGGTTWTQFDQPILQNQSFFGVAARGNVILAGSNTALNFGLTPGVQPGALYRSADRGVSWSVVSGTSGLPTGDILDLVGDPGINDRFYVAVSGHGVYRSDDAGVTWTSVNTGLNGASTAVNMRIGIHNTALGNVVYVGIVGIDPFGFGGILSGVYRSTTKGNQWTAMDVPAIHGGAQGEVHFALAADPTNPNLVYLGGDALQSPPYTGIVVRGNASLPHGGQFSSIVAAFANNTSPHADTRYLGFDAAGNLIDGCDGGIFRRSVPASTAGSWTAMVGDLAITEAHAVAWDSISHTAIIGTQDNGVQQQLTPAGTLTWEALPSGDGGDVAVDNTSLASLNEAIRYYSSQYLLGFQRDVIDANNNIINSTPIDTSAISDAQFYSPIRLNAVDPSRLLIGGAANLWESKNQGNSFTKLGPPGANEEIDPMVYGGRSGGVANPDLIYVGSAATVYKRTTAGGPITATTALPGATSDVKDLAVDPLDWKTVIAIDDSQVFISRDAGASWSNITGNFLALSSTDFSSLAFIPGFQDSSIVVGTRSGVFTSHLSAPGAWSKVGTGLPDVLVADLDYNAADDVLVAGTLGRSVWTFSNASTELNPPSFALDETFHLHSDRGATNVIYLDFVGFATRNTTWNAQSGLPNILTPAFDLDGDALTFSSVEEESIQSIWERVSEDFRPFDVDVTTEDPGAAAIASNGIRVVVGGSVMDWAGPLMQVTEDHLGQSNSFGSSTPAFVFSNDLAASPELDVAIAESTSHVIGTTLGLQPMGYFTIDPNPNAPPPFLLTDHTYYLGEDGPVSWAPIMGEEGGMYDKELTQWSKGEYFQSDNIEDELQIISSTLGYRQDDHGNTITTAATLPVNFPTPTSTIGDIAGQGIIEKNTDIDVFSFSVDSLGGVVNLDISPSLNGANLDVMARLLDSSGTLIATSNPVDDIFAGSQTYDPLNNVDEGGWVLTDGTHTDTLFLTAGTYYVSVQGTGRPPGQPNPDPTMADSGYSNYGSLGYYSITGTLGKGFVIGVDFDADGGAAPTNWNQYFGGGPSDVLTGLISESGSSVPYQLSISSTGSSIDTFPTSSPTGINAGDIPTHSIPLDGLDGYIGPQAGDTLTFTWSNLTPWSYHQVYVFGHADFEAHNVVTITGGNINGVVQTIPFTQIVEPNGLEVNSDPPSNNELQTFAYTVLSDGSGQISIAVTNEPGYQAGIAGLAIAPTQPIGAAKPGSITGTKFNDLNGSQTKDPGEPGLAGWVIYLDTNNNGILDSITTPGEPDQTVTTASTDIPQVIPDPDTVIHPVKSDLDFTQNGTIVDVNITLDITHTYDADLEAFLISPSGTRVKLFQNIGGFNDNFTNTTFDDQAVISIAAGSAPYTGSFKPAEVLSTFNGENPFGTWQLEISDDAASDVGTLNSWSITVNLQGAQSTTTFLEPFTTTNAQGNYSFTKLPPGLYNVREYFQPDQILAGWQQTFAPPTPLTVISGATVNNTNFGNWIPVAQRGSIQGTKFYDGNKNGIHDPLEAGLPGWVVYIDSNDNGILDSSTTATIIPSADVPQPITDFNTTTSTIDIGNVGTVSNVELTLDVTHSFVGDLDAELISPSGRIVKLFTNVGGQYNDFHNLTFADSAARSIDTIGFNDVPYTGRWRPEDPLATFQGDDATGIWTLVIHDTAFADEGSLNSWSLSFNTSEAFQTTDATGHYEFDNLPAGQYIVREQPQTGWMPIDPSLTDIPAAVWANSKWVVTVVGLDNFSDPDGPDSHRNVKNVDFGNFANPGSLQGVVYSDLDSSASKTPNEPGLPGWTVFVDANGNGTLDTGTVNTTVSSTSASAINNFFVVQSKVLFGVPASVSDVNLSLGITHTYDADLTAYLISPKGTRVKLFSGVGGSGDDFTGTIFDDSASQSITSGTAPFSDSFRPEEALSAFNGESALGYWTLEITDGTAADNGTLNAWSLTITGDELSTTTDAQGHYSFANLPPGVYAVDTVQKPGWIRTEVPGEVILAANAVSANVNFGNHSPLVLPGDYNNDGLVDSSDYITWRKALGSSVPNFTGADGDGDGVVGQSDYDIWRLNFGHSLISGGSGSSVGSGLAAVKSTAAPVGSALTLSSTSYTGNTSLSAGTLSVSPSLMKAGANVGTALGLSDSANTLASQSVAISLSNVDPVGTFAQAPSTSQNSTASVLLFGSALEISAGFEVDLVDVTSPAAANSESDLGLLAWLESSPAATADGNEWSEWKTESDASTSSDSSESIDAAFAMLEDSALVGATI